MTNPTTLQLIQLCLMLVSVVVYVWFLITIIRFRKVHPFNSSFFTLTLALGVTDLQCLFSSWVFGKFKSFGWLFMDSLGRNFNRPMAKATVLLSTSGVNQQIIGVAIMALNRCTALAYFDKHDLIWTPRFICGVVGFQFLAPLAAVFPVVISQEQFLQVDNITGKVGSLKWVNGRYQAYTAIGTFLHMWLVNILSGVLYTITFWKVRKTLNTTRPQPEGTSNNSSPRNLRMEVRLGFVGLSLSVLLAIYGWILFKLATVDPALHSVYGAAWAVTNDVFSWCNPWLCLVMSKVVREHMLALFKRQPTAGKSHRTGRSQSKPTKQHDGGVELPEIK